MKKLIYPLLLSSLLIAGFAQVSYGSWPFNPEAQPKPESISSILARITPAVVRILAQGDVTLNQLPSPIPAPLYSHHFENSGSGVIVNSKKGYILTNAHVIRGAKKITVTLNDKRVLQATLKSSDQDSDIALLQIHSKNLTAIPLGNSDALRVGDSVAAIGYPLGLNQTVTVTSGIVSALQRTGLGIEGYENFIQTDASINAGNSGGALINKQGQLIGINTAIISSNVNSGNIGIGFAIPINMAYGIMVQLEKYGSIHRGLIGVVAQDLTPKLATALEVPPATSGALVTRVPENSPGARAGIKPGDIIQSISTSSMQSSIRDAGQVRNTVGMLRAGDKLSIGILRKTGKFIVKLNLIDPLQYRKATERDSPFLYGLILNNFKRTIPGRGNIKGVEVVNIDENSTAWSAGIRPGDIITSANQIPVEDAEQLQALAKTKQSLLVNILSRITGDAHFVVITKPIQ